MNTKTIIEGLQLYNELDIEGRARSMTKFATAISDAIDVLSNPEPKSVYILWYHYCKYGEETHTIEGIFATKKAAESQLRYYSKEYPVLAEGYSIEEHKLEY